MFRLSYQSINDIHTTEYMAYLLNQHMLNKLVPVNLFTVAKVLHTHIFLTAEVCQYSSSNAKIVCYNTRHIMSDNIYNILI